MGEVPRDPLVEACIRGHAAARVPGLIELRHGRGLFQPALSKPSILPWYHAYYP